MEVRWRLRCDRGHMWEITLEAGVDPPYTAARCPQDGSPAVTATPMPPADRVSIRLIPAAYVADPVKLTVADDDKFYLELSSIDGSDVLRSTTALVWDKAVSRAAAFRGRDWASAVATWRRIGMR